ncbi:flagellar export chaperone FliS [Methylocaldum szegediense]|jgi:flagellar protein FliS|uniref:Flagellar secretion chaperone FliS n=1 Tax=Methylocaldum szegediense TaxID=73780 RepID=A0ABM9I873_9GAMM|nr:flagellar export chaperone FliS [Methylocaldum szegediense]CAI8952280.1 Flagellar secretion chaperone FliSB [Methylocaldum szegediense]
MNAYARRQFVNEYANVNAQAGINDASPHRLIQMLMEGFLARVNTAKGAMKYGNVTVKGENISKAIAIVGGLEEGLDMEKGGELAQNLRNMYHYIRSRLLVANKENQPQILDEVAGLMREIKSAWDAIPNELHHMRHG